MKKTAKMLKMKGSWCFSEGLKMDIGYYFTKILFKSVGAYQLTGFHWNKKCFSCKVYLKIIKFALIVQLKLLQVNLWNFQGSPFQQNTPILNKSVQSFWTSRITLPQPPRSGSPQVTTTPPSNTAANAQPLAASRCTLRNRPHTSSSPPPQATSPQQTSVPSPLSAEKTLMVATTRRTSIFRAKGSHDFQRDVLSFTPQKKRGQFFC